MDIKTVDQSVVDSLKLQIELSLIKTKLTWYDVFAYSYCYVGILTGTTNYLNIRQSTIHYFFF